MSLDYHVIPFRRPPGKVPHAVVLAAALVLAVGAAVGVRRTPQAEPPAQVEAVAEPVAEPLTGLPTREEVRAAVVRSAQRPPRGDPSRLGPEWRFLADARYGREVVAGILEELERQRVTPTRPIRPEAEVDYLVALWETWSGRASRGVRSHEATRRRDERREAGLARIATPERTVGLRAVEWVALAVAAGLVVATLVDRERRFRPVLLDAHSIRSGPVRMLWEDLADVRWDNDHVVLVPVEGKFVRLDAVDLDEAGIAQAEALTRRLLARASHRADASSAREELARLLGRGELV